MGKRSHRVNYAGYIADLMKYVDSHGLKIKPFPVVRISNRKQDGVFIKTGYYDPNEKTITIFVNSRHPKDVLRSVAHELVHHNQNLEGRLAGSYSGEKVTEDDGLKPLESEAYEKGNMLFRSWTEEFQKDSVPHKTFTKHMQKKVSKINEGTEKGKVDSLNLTEKDLVKIVSESVMRTVVDELSKRGAL